MIAYKILHIILGSLLTTQGLTLLLGVCRSKIKAVS